VKTKSGLGIILLILTTSVLADVLDPLTADQRHQNAYNYRLERAKANRRVLPAIHSTNNDEMAVASYQGQFHKTLPHDANGVVDPNETVKVSTLKTL
jgi:hypothetical protein